mgnify:CR=1 FL=1
MIVSAEGMATLVYTDVDGVDRSFSLGGDPVMVGRAADCAIRSEDPRVSRMHARFYLDQGQLWVEDLGSSNGTFINEKKITKMTLTHNDVVRCGTLQVRFVEVEPG